MSTDRDVSQSGTPSESTEGAAEASTGAADDAESGDATDEPSTREERRDRRTRTRLTEERDRLADERDRLRSTLEPFVRSEVEKLASERLADGSALWILPDASPLDFLDEETNAVDAEKVKETIDRLLRHAPTLERRRFEGSADGGNRAPMEKAKSEGWSDLLKQK